MNNKLAIKGHVTRGKEVIKLLEMLGGINDQGYIGTNTWKDEYYFLDNGYIRAYDWCDGIKFTLEEFLEKHPFKVGDKVTLDDKLCSITWMCWECNNVYYYVESEIIKKKVTTEKLKPYKETNMNENKFGTAKEPLKTKSNAVKLVDGKVKDDLNNDENEFPSFEPMFRLNDEFEYKIPDGYEITDVLKDKVCIKPIKPKYPTTYEVCSRIMGVGLWNTLWGEDATEYEEQTEDLIKALIKLKVCRDAYWKIAGEEMGLGKPWKSNWENGRNKFCIINCENSIIRGVYAFANSILAFPTEEMRDAFYENFKELIESCKELL